MVPSRFLRLLSSLLVMNLSLISGQRAECAMGKASNRATGHMHPEVGHSGHHAKAGHDATAVTDSTASCDMGCPPAACGTGSHCSTVVFQVDSRGEALPVIRGVSLLAFSTSTDRLVHSPEPPPPRA